MKKLTQVLIPLSDTDSWNKALLSVPSHQYTHMHWYNRAMRNASSREIYLYHGYSDNFSVVCPISPRRMTELDPLEVTTPYGFSGFAVEGYCKSFSTEWHEFMCMQGYVCGHIALHPFQDSEFLYATGEMFTGKNTYFINLKQSIEDIKKRLSADHRHRLRQWQKSGYEVIREKSDEVVTAFIELYKHAFITRQAASVYDFGEAAWREVLAAKESHVFSVKCDGVIEAVALFIFSHGIADYYMIASTDAGRMHARGIIMDAIHYFHEQGAGWLHLGCGVRENDALEQFKARFGGVAYATCALKQVYNNQVYHNVCNKYDVDPASRQGYFPSYWAAATATTG